MLHTSPSSSTCNNHDNNNGNNDNYIYNNNSNNISYNNFENNSKNDNNNNNIEYSSNYNLNNNKYNLNNNNNLKHDNNNTNYNKNNSDLDNNNNNNNNKNDDNLKIDSKHEDSNECTAEVIELPIKSESRQESEIDVENINASQVEETNQQRYETSLQQNPQGVTQKEHQNSIPNVSSSLQQNSFLNHSLSKHSNHSFSNHSISSLSNSNNFSDQLIVSDNMFSIIRTNPSITSLLLDKHTTAFSGKYFAHLSSSLPSNLPKLSTQTDNNRNQNYSINISDDSKLDVNRAKLCAVSTPESFLTISSKHPFTSCNQPSVALRNLLLKPSCLQETKLNNNGKNTNNQKINKSKKDSLDKNKLKCGMEVFGNEYEHKYKKDEVDFQGNEIVTNMSPKYCCGGCNCGCDFCPQSSDKKVVNEKTDFKELKITDSFSCIDTNVLDSNPLNEKDKKDNSIESSLLVKDGYKHNGHFVLSNLQQNTISDNYFEKQFYPDNKIYIYHKNKEHYNVLGKTDKDILHWLKEKKEMEENLIESINCCSKNSNSYFKTSSCADTSPLLETKNHCLSKRKFIELKNKLSPVGSCINRSSPLKSRGCCGSKEMSENCDAPCCKRNKQCNCGNVTQAPAPTTFSMCANNCNPASCPCPGTQDNCSMGSCRKETTSQDLHDSSKTLTDTSSISDSSTISVASVKTEPDEKFIPPFKINVSTQWEKDDFEESILHKDFSVQCNIEEVQPRLELDKCALCNCCLPLQNSLFPVSPLHSSPSSSSPQPPSNDSHKTHVEKVTEVGLKCVHCGISFDDEVIFSIHMGSHSHHDPFTCNLCGKKCSNKYAFNTHILHGHHFSS